MGIVLGFFNCLLANRILRVPENMGCDERNKNTSGKLPECEIYAFSVKNSLENVRRKCVGRRGPQWLLVARMSQRCHLLSTFRPTTGTRRGAPLSNAQNPNVPRFLF